MPTALEIAEEIGNTGSLKRKSKVMSFEDLPGVPQGTKGLIALVNGWDKWIRYRVLFDNGVDLGNLNRELLSPAKQYQELVNKRDKAIESGVFDRVAVADTAGDEAGADAGGGSGDGDVVINGVTVSASWFAKAAAARERLGVPKPE